MKHFLLLLLVFLFQRKLFPSWWAKKNKSVLICKPDAIGDSVIWLDSAQYYRKMFPTQHLILVHASAWSEMAVLLPYFDECIPISMGKMKANLWYRISLAWRFSHIRYDTAILPCFSRDFFHTDWLMHQINAKEKIGFDGNYDNTNNSLVKFTSEGRALQETLHQRANRWYTRLMVADPQPQMELLRNIEFINKLGAVCYSAQLPVFPFALPQSPISLPSSYIVLALGASTLRKAFPVDKIAHIANAIPLRYTLVCIGSAKESRLCDELKKQIKDVEKVIDLCGKTSLLDLCCVIQEASLLVGNDTASSHIAVAVKTPSICLMGGGHYGRFQPYPKACAKTEEDQKILPVVVSDQRPCFGCGWVCAYPLSNGRWPCVNAIDADTVLAEIKKILVF